MLLFVGPITLTSHYYFSLYRRTLWPFRIVKNTIFVFQRHVAVMLLLLYGTGCYCPCFCKLHVCNGSLDTGPNSVSQKKSQHGYVSSDPCNGGRYWEVLPTTLRYELCRGTGCCSRVYYCSTHTIRSA